MLTYSTTVWTDYTLAYYVKPVITITEFNRKVKVSPYVDGDFGINVYKNSDQYLSSVWGSTLSPDSLMPKCKTGQDPAIFNCIDDISTFDFTPVCKSGQDPVKINAGLQIIINLFLILK